MKAIKRLSDEQKQKLRELETDLPETLSVDDVMTFGGNGLVEFVKGRGIELTKKGRKAVGIIEKAPLAI